MIDRVVSFVHALRHAGVRVSMSESMDAAETLRHIHIEDRSAFKLSLRAALIKAHQDFQIYDALFERFFMVRVADQANDGPNADAPEGPPDEQPNPCGESQDGEEAAEMMIEEGEMTGVQPMPKDDAEDETRDEPDSDELDVYEVAQMLARIQVGEPTAQAMAQPGRQLQRNGVENVDLYQELPPGEVENLYEAVEELAANLVTRRSLRFRRSRTGPVDIKRTIQKSFRTGNIPFYIIRKRRKISKHELAVLCDISGSVWEVARFFLKLVQEMQSQFSRARSFLFVDRVSEVTDLFDDQPFDKIIEQLKEDPGLNFFGLSDFGRAFYQFYSDYLKSLSRNTVLVILGDARANWFDPLEWTLDEMQRRTRMVIWLNPEPEQYWDTDDSVMSKYSLYCDHVLECRNLEQLKRVGELILQE